MEYPYCTSEWVWVGDNLLQIDDNFSTGLDPCWQIGEIGSGRVRHQAGALHLTLPATNDQVYSDAQITDYDPAIRAFQYTPPLRMTVTAYATLSTPKLRGTAGVGFWNHPFVPGERGFRLPQAVWFFFSSPPNNIQLAQDVPGPGWKAATFNAKRWQFFALLPAAPIGFLLMHIPALYRRLWGIGQRAIGVSELLLDEDLLHETHTYTIDWLREQVLFRVDGEIVHQTDLSPRNHLGFIAWIDNQYAIVTPQGRFGFGLVDVPTEQSLVLDAVRIEGL